MRLRHRPHKGPQRHLNPPFGAANRRHGGRLHLKAEGRESRHRSDRPKRRDVGGGTGSLTPAQIAAMQQAATQRPSSIGSADMSQALTQQAMGQKRGGRVAKGRAKGGRAERLASDRTAGFSGPRAIPSPPVGDEDEDRKAGGGKWIQKAIKRPGALHRALHVPEGEKIPAKKLAKASHSENPRIRRMVGLAKTLKKMH